MSAGNPVPPPIGGTPPKKPLSPVVIILIVLAGLFVLGGLLIVAGGVFFLHKAKQAGLDPDLMQRNPALAATKMIAAMNPEVEVVTVDESSGKITLREKKTGKIVRLDFEQVKQGKITFEGDEGKVTVEGTAEGNNASLRVQTPEGSYQYNAKITSMPLWMPRYPNAEQKTAGSTDTPEGKGFTIHLTTKDSLGKVLGFYKEKLEGSGLTVSVVEHGTTGIVTAQDSEDKKSATITITEADGETVIGSSFLEKK